MKLVGGIISYFRGVKAEFLKVKWPTKAQFQRSFMLVIVGVIVATTLVTILDIGLKLIVKNILI